MLTGVKTALTAAGLTGVFCACFAFAMHFLAPMVSVGPVILISFTSGFLGSLFARLVMGKKNDKTGIEAMFKLGYAGKNELDRYRLDYDDYCFCASTGDGPHAKADSEQPDFDLCPRTG